MTNTGETQVWRIFLDPHWYSRRYGDVPSDPDLAASHFSEYGLVLGRVPGPMFDPEWYSQRYPDVVASGMLPAKHFLAVGWRELRIPSAEAGAALEIVRTRSDWAKTDLSDPLTLWQEVAALWWAVTPARRHDLLTMDEQRWYNVTLDSTGLVDERRARETPS